MKDKVMILSINPGSTSTKIAVYENEKRVLAETMNYSTEELEKHVTLQEQRDFRAGTIEAALEKAGYDSAGFDVVVGRGGGLMGVQTGAYIVDDAMLEHQYAQKPPYHASILGGMTAKYFSDKSGCKAYIYDATGADEMQDIARITGFKDVYRKGGAHVLNQRASAIRYAKEQGKKMEDLRLVVAHIGGGITLMAFENGKMIDLVGDIEGPFSPERCGQLNVDTFMNLFADQGCDKKAMNKLIRGRGGLVAHLGTNSAVDVEKMIDDGDKKAKLIYEAMCYRIAKAIGMLVVVLKGDVDAIIITGSIAHSKRVTDFVTDYVKKLAPVVLYPGENELESLSMGGLRIYRGEETARKFDLNEVSKSFSIDNIK